MNPSARSKLAAAAAKASAQLLDDDSVQVRPDECLCCYLIRMTQAFGCPSGDLLWTRRWIASQSRPYSRVIGWARRNGGFCDCELVMNIFSRTQRQRDRALQCDAAYDELTRAEDVRAVQPRDE